MDDDKFEHYVEQVRDTYTPERAIAYAILALAEAVKYHADVTAPPLPPKSDHSWEGLTRENT